MVFQAFVIAYTSDFIPRMVYKYKYSQTETLEGYIDSSLSGMFFFCVLKKVYRKELVAVFNTSHYHENMGPEDRDIVPPDICQYRGNLFSPSKLLILNQ